MGKMLTGEQLMKMEYSEVAGISKELRDSIGDIEDSFSCVIWGKSGNGKTTFSMEFLAQLQASLGTVLYLSYEEGHGKSFKIGLKRSNVDLADIKIMNDCSFDELIEILSRRQSPKIVVFDSLQYSGLTFIQYQKIKQLHMFGRSQNARKIFLFISHATGKLADGKTASKIVYDANIKIHVDGFIAFVKSRYGTKKNFVIYEAGAKDYWGDDFDNHTCEIGKKKIKKTIKTPKNAATKKE